MATLMREAGAHLLVYPGAFNLITGPQHWELLARKPVLLLSQRPLVSQPPGPTTLCPHHVPGLLTCHGLQAHGLWITSVGSRRFHLLATRKPRTRPGDTLRWCHPGVRCVSAARVHLISVPLPGSGLVSYHERHPHRV